MSRIRILFLLAGILSLNNPAAFAQGAGIEWDTLNEEVIRLYQAGDYKRATVIAEKALGPDHPDVATSLENLASLYRATNRPELAKPLEARAAKIRAIKR